MDLPSHRACMCCNTDHPMRYPDWSHSGRAVGVTDCFLIGFESYEKEEIHAWYCKSRQKLMAGVFINQKPRELRKIQWEEFKAEDGRVSVKKLSSRHDRGLILMSSWYLITSKWSTHNQACQYSGMDGRSSTFSWGAIGSPWHPVEDNHFSLAECMLVSCSRLLGGYTCMFMQAALSGLSGLFLKIEKK